MRLIKTRILLILILKGTFGSAMVVSFNNESCCSSKGDLTEISYVDISTNDQNEDKGCCDYGCDCVCCVHTLIYDELPAKEFNKPVLHREKKIIYTNNYFFLLAEQIWQPPGNSNDVEPY